MLFTQTIQIRSKIQNSANQARVVSQDRQYGACIVATATLETVLQVEAVLAGVKSRAAALAKEQAEALQSIGFQSEAAFNAALRSGKIQGSRMGVVHTIQGLSLKLRMLSKEIQRINLVMPRVGDQVVVIWKTTPETAQSDLAMKKGRVANYLRQAYTLEVRTDFETVAKPERS
jgi:hypothetical protein